jgi:hypothetical protein
LGGEFSVFGFPVRSDMDVVITERLLNSVYIEDPVEAEPYSLGCFAGVHHPAERKDQ